MAGQCHDIVLTKTAGEPAAQTGKSQVVELAPRDLRMCEDLTKLPCEVIDRAEALVELESSFLSQLTYSRIACRRYQDISAALWENEVTVGYGRATGAIDDVV